MLRQAAYTSQSTFIYYTTNNNNMEDTDISRKTWNRNIESVNKVGFMDGAADGQVAVFQQSFDMGYKQGFIFGMELGKRNYISSMHQQEISINHKDELQDSRKINCYLCINGMPPEQNVVNLYNTQQERNSKVFG